jgi:hypothetical protein
MKTRYIHHFRRITTSYNFGHSAINSLFHAVPSAPSMGRNIVHIRGEQSKDHPTSIPTYSAPEHRGLEEQRDPTCIHVLNDTEAISGESIFSPIPSYPMGMKAWQISKKLRRACILA